MRQLKTTDSTALLVGMVLVACVEPLAPSASKAPRTTAEPSMNAPAESKPPASPKPDARSDDEDSGVPMPDAPAINPPAAGRASEGGAGSAGSPEPASAPPPGNGRRDAGEPQNPPEEPPDAGPGPPKDRDDGMTAPVEPTPTQGIVGIWSGTVLDRGFGNLMREMRVCATVTQTENAGPAGMVSYDADDADCTSRLEFISLTDTRYRFRETASGPEGFCPDGFLELELRDEKALRYEWYLGNTTLLETTGTLAPADMCP